MDRVLCPGWPKVDTRKEVIRGGRRGLQGLRASVTNCNVWQGEAGVPSSFWPPAHMLQSLQGLWGPRHRCGHLVPQHCLVEDNLASASPPSTRQSCRHLPTAQRQPCAAC